MVAPLLPQTVPLVAAGLPTTEWWRWFRDLVRSIEAIAAESGGGGELEGAAPLIPGEAITAQSLAVGENTINHNLGRVPQVVFPIWLDGAFGEVDTGIFPHIATPQGASNGNSLNVTTDQLELDWTPDNGTSLLLLYTCESTVSPVITSVSQDGVAWTQLEKFVGGDTTEVWLGKVSDNTQAGINTVNINYASGSSNDRSYCVLDIPEISGTEKRDGVGFASSSGQLVSSDGARLVNGWTTPACEPGDLMITILADSSISGFAVGATNGWKLENFARSPAAQAQLACYAKIAQTSGGARFLGAANSSGSRDIVQVTIPTTISSTKTTVPHGITVTAATASTITLNSATSVTADLWLA